MERTDRETWAKRVERWKDSGLSAAQFATELGISPKALSWWKWQLAKGDTKAKTTKRNKRSSETALSPLSFVEMAAPLRREPIEIVLPSGLRIRVPVDFDVAALGRLVDVLETR